MDNEKVAGLAAAGTKSFGYLFGAWVLLTACLMVGLATVAIEHAAANEFKIASVDLVGIAGPAAVPTSDDDDSGPTASMDVDLESRLDSPVVYGATAWTVLGSRLISRTDDVASRPIVVADVVVSNVSLDVATRVRSSDVNLIWPDGHRQPVDRFEFIDDRRVFSLEPGESLPVTLVFKPNLLKNPDITELTLQIGEPGRIPAELPIVGPAPDATFPRFAAFDGPAMELPGTTTVATPVILRPELAAIDLNAGHYRAAVGQRIAVIDVSVEGVATGTDAPYTESTFWQLVVGDQTIEPLRVTSRADDQITVLFTIDAGTGEMVLTGGVTTGDPVRYVISVPFEEVD